MNTEILIPNIHNSNIRVQRVCTAPSDFYYDWHIHSQCEMYICLNGRSRLYVHDREYQLSSGDIFFVNEYVPHKTFTYKDTVSFLIQFSTDFYLGETINLPHSFSSFSGCSEAVFKTGSPANAQLQKCLAEILEENTNRKIAYTQYIKATLQKIIAVLCRNNVLFEGDEFLQKKQLARFLPVIEYINNHYCERVSLDEVSRILHVDKAHFCRIFKEAMNTSFVKYLNLVRICKAQELLLETDKTISQISYETGFSSPSYFTETFKQINFCSPIMYRKMKNKK